MQNVVGSILYYSTDKFLKEKLGVNNDQHRIEMIDSISRIKQNPDFEFPSETTPKFGSLKIAPKIPVSESMLRLKCIDGPCTKREDIVTENCNIIGRLADPSVLTFPDLHISRKHCQLILRGNTVYLKDLGSTTGTFVRISLPIKQPDNSYKNSETKLINGSLFRIGMSEFQVIMQDGCVGLKIYEGPKKGEEFLLDKTTITIGRTPTNEISIPTDSEMSSKHATLFIKADGLYIRDENSTNKYFIINW